MVLWRWLSDTLIIVSATLMCCHQQTADQFVQWNPVMLLFSRWILFTATLQAVCWFALTAVAATCTSMTVPVSILIDDHWYDFCIGGHQWSPATRRWWRRWRKTVMVDVKVAPYLLPREHQLLSNEIMIIFHYFPPYLVMLMCISCVVVNVSFSLMFSLVILMPTCT